MTDTELRISAAEDFTANQDTSIAELQHTVQILVAISDNAETRLRQNNVRVLGLSEENRPAEFAEEFFNYRCPHYP